MHSASLDARDRPCCVTPKQIYNMAADVLNALPSQNRFQGKVSRYRSVRPAQPKQQADDALEIEPSLSLPEATNVQQPVKRSMSRYHRAPPASGFAAMAPHARESSGQLSSIPVPEIPKQAVPLNYMPPSSSSRALDVQAPSKSDGTMAEYSTRRATRRPTTSPRNESSTSSSQGVDHPRRRPDTVGRTEGGVVLANERTRHERIKAQQWAEKEARDKLVEEESQRKAREREEMERLEREKRKEEERAARQKEGERAQQARERAEAKRIAHGQRLEKNKPVDIKAPTRKDYNSRNSSSAPNTASPNSARRFGGFFRRKKDAESPRRTSVTEDQRPKTNYKAPKEMPTIRPGGGGIVPLNDAPVSGVKGADRRVRIEFGKSSITLPVNLTTSALQLIRSASTVMSEDFDPRAAVLNELHTMQGVRRPLRMYEHVRDVMNSWESDLQHSLVIERSDMGSDNELYFSFAPKQEPQTQSWWLYYAHKPGKWDERWVTVRSDGQVTTAKSESGKELANTCHLSDFDIYVPIEKQKKRGKTSKKIVFAIKSQEKSSMFLNKANFIHFFYTSDKNAADTFFRTIQAWRSYYLVNKMGQGPASKGEQKGNGEVLKDKLHARNRSADSHYLLGTFDNLDLDFSSYNKPPELLPQPATMRRSDSFNEDRPLGTFGFVLPSAQEHSRLIHTKKMSQRKERTYYPPTAFKTPHDSGFGSNSNHRPNPSWNSQSSDNGAFSPNGLLGATYEQRQQDMQRTSQDVGLQRGHSVRSSRSQRRNSFDSASLHRSGSMNRQLQMPKPLVDLTPQYKEPPQFQKKGKGYRPDQLGPGGLIDSATSPEVAIQIPPSQDWRARPVTSAGLDRSKSVRSTKGGRLPSGASFETGEPFTGGLLAQNGPWGTGNKGHGVLSGNMAKGPMVDLNERSRFADGSLLRRVERDGMGNPIER